jgi:hypothetical protein
MKAPILANWLLSRLIAPPQSNAIAGDLMEQWRSGRSRLWLWRQGLLAIVICNWREIQGHKNVSISGILTGMLALWCFATLMTTVLSSMGLLVHAVNWRWPHYIQMFSIALVYGAASGWIVGRLHPAHQRTAVFAFYGFTLTAIVWQLPLYYLVAPSVFFSSILPHLPFFLIGSLVASPSILVGGLSLAPTATD